MFENGLIIRTRKLSPREVKKKLHDFIDSISEDCGQEVEQLAEDLKAHGDEFVDVLSGNIGNNRGIMYRNGGRAWHRDGSTMGGTAYRNEGSAEERENLRQRNEQELQDLDRKLKELKMRMNNM